MARESVAVESQMPDVWAQLARALPSLQEANSHFRVGPGPPPTPSPAPPRSPLP